VQPIGDSASDYFKRAQNLQPDSVELLELRSPLTTALTTAAALSLADDDFDRSILLVETAFELGADSETLAQLDLELTAMQRAAAAGEAAEAEQRQLFELAQSRIAANRLITPEGFSAKDQLLALRALNPNYPGLEQSWQILLDGIVASAEQTLADGAWAATERWLEALAELGPATPVLARLREALDAGTRQERYLEEFAGPAELELVSAVAAIYPAMAVRRGVEGWVDVQFRLDRTGTPADVVVVDSQPSGYFEDAALLAIGGYRYAPYEFDGRVYERLARVRVRFDLK
jgi:TonB family protein